MATRDEASIRQIIDAVVTRDWLGSFQAIDGPSWPHDMTVIKFVLYSKKVKKNSKNYLLWI